MNSDMKLHVSACEIYLNDCYDLLNKKVKIPIAGFGTNKKSNAGGEVLSRTEVKRDAKGKWVAPLTTCKEVEKRAGPTELKG